MTAMTWPTPTLVLPGSWYRVAVSDRARIDALLGIVGAEGTAREEFLTFLAEADFAPGAVIMVRRAEERPALILTAWPDQFDPQPGLDGLVARARAAGLEATPLEHRHGFPAVRVAGPRVDGGGVSATYWISHPATARDLVLLVTRIGPDCSAADLNVYEAAVASTTWKEDV